MENNKIKSRLYLVIAAILWGLAGICVKSITWSAMSQMAARSFIGIIFMLAINKFKMPKISKGNFLGAIFMSITGILYLQSIKLTTAGTAIILQYTAPIFVFLFSFVFQKKKTSKLQFLLVFLVFFGCMLSFISDISLTKFIGNILGLVSGITYAGQIISMNHKDTDAMDIIILGNVISIILCAPTMFFDSNLVFTSKNIIWILILGIFQYSLANFLFAKGIKGIDKIEGSLILTLEPIFNPIPVAIMGIETMGAFSILGAAIVIIGIVLYSLIFSKTS